MSTIRRCDSKPYCVSDPTGQEPWKRDFSEADPGWTTGTMIINDSNERGVVREEEIQQDLCPPCSDVRRGIKRDKVTGRVEDPKHAAEQARQARMDPAYIEWLERQNNIGPYAITQDS